MTLPVTVSIERYQNALPAIAIAAGGEQRTFLFDTGAGITCVAPALAATLGVEPFGKLVGMRMRGQMVELRRVEGVDLEVRDVPLVPPTVGVLDLAAFLPEGWPPVDGVLGLDAFVAQPLTIDLSGRALTLESPESLARRRAVGHEVEIRVARPVQAFAREVFVAAQVKGRTLWLELDTANTAPVLLGNHVGLEGDGEITLDLGAATWTGAFCLQEMILDGNLGQSFLAGRAITLDLEAERMTVAASS